MRIEKLITGLCAAAMFLAFSGIANAGNDTGNVRGTDLTGAATQTVSVAAFAGAAVTNYNFEVPPGRAGMQPSLAILYNSGNTENGYLGRGWTLPLPEIRRNTRYGEPLSTFPKFVLGSSDKSVE